MIARRSWSLGVLSVGLLLILTGCPSLIANVVSPSQSIQQAIDQAQPGDVIRFMGTHQENVTIDKDGLSLIGDGPDAKIEGTLMITGDRVKTENFIVDGDVMLDGDSGEFQDMQITGVLDTPSGSFEDGMFTNFAVGGWGFNVGGFGVHDVDSQATVTLNGTFSCADIVQPSESIQTAIDNTDANANKRPICVAGSTRRAAPGDPDGPPLVVDKSVHLQAMGPVTLEATEAPTEGFLTIVLIDNDNVRIEGFTLTTDALDTGWGVRIPSGVADVELENLTVTRTRTAISTASVSQISLRRSTIQNNQFGVTVNSNTGSVDVLVEMNNIVGNFTGIRHLSSVGETDAVDAEDNWWGDTSGPNDSLGIDESIPLNGKTVNCTGTPADEFNSSGSGDDVVDNEDGPVDYCPWATSSF